MRFRLLTRQEIETVPGMPAEIPDSLFVTGLVDEKGVAAALGVFFVLHADPIWIREDHRASGKLLLRLWEAARQEIRRRNLGPELFVGMTDTNPGEPTEDLVARMCETAGGGELKARFFTVPVYPDVFEEKSA